MIGMNSLCFNSFTISISIFHFSLFTVCVHCSLTLNELQRAFICYLEKVFSLCGNLCSDALHLLVIYICVTNVNWRLRRRGRRRRERCLNHSMEYACARLLQATWLLLFARSFSIEKEKVRISNDSENGNNGKSIASSNKTYTHFEYVSDDKDMVEQREK